MQRFKLEVDNSTIVRVLVIAAIFVIGLILIWRLMPALTIILVAFVLALALNPSVHSLSNYMPRKSRLLATIITFLVMIGILLLFLYIILPPLIEQSSLFIATLPDYISSLGQQQGFVADLILRYELQDELAQLAQNAKGQIFNLAGGLGASLVSGFTSLLGGLAITLTVLVLSFLMLIEAPYWANRVWSLYANKKKREQHEKLITSMYRVVGGYVNGQVLVAFIAGAAALVVLAILTLVFGLRPGIALPLAGVVFITSLIPLIGATIGAILVVLVLLFNDFAAAVSFLVYFLVYQQIENNFLQPMVQSRTVALSALGVFIAVIIGIGLLGPLGGILAIPIAGCLRVLALYYFENRKDLKKLTQE